MFVANSFLRTSLKFPRCCKTFWDVLLDANLSSYVFKFLVATECQYLHSVCWRGHTWLRAVEVSVAPVRCILPFNSFLYTEDPNIISMRSCLLINHPAASLLSVSFSLLLGFFSCKGYSSAFSAFRRVFGYKALSTCHTCGRIGLVGSALWHSREAPPLGYCFVYVSSIVVIVVCH